MAPRRGVRFVLIFIGAAVLVSIAGMVLMYLAVVRGPSVPESATLVLRPGGDIQEVVPYDVVGQVFGREANTVRGFVEMMHSDEMLVRITGNPKWADRAEEIAFNSLPCAMTPDLKGLHYLTAPNQIQLDRADKSPMVQNRGDMFSYNPHQYRCCQHNVAFGWPYFVESLWMATGDDGLAAVLGEPLTLQEKRYIASNVHALAGGTDRRLGAAPFDGC